MNFYYLTEQDEPDASSVSSRLSNRRLSTLYYGLVYGKRNQEVPVKCAKTLVIITHFSDQPLR